MKSFALAVISPAAAVCFHVPVMHSNFAIPPLPEKKRMGQ